MSKEELSKGGGDWVALSNERQAIEVLAIGAASELAPQASAAADWARLRAKKSTPRRRSLLPGEE